MHLLIEKTLRSATAYFQDFFIHEYGRKTYLHSVHPSVKLIGTVFLILLSIGTFDLKKIVLVILAVYILAFNTGLSLLTLARRSILFPIFSVIIVLPVALYGKNFEYLVAFPLRVFSSISSLQLFILTTKFNETLFGLKKLKIPESMLHIIWITYRYTISMFRDLLNVLIARESRRLRRSAHLETLRGGSKSLGLFLLRSFETAERVELAMNSRGKCISYGGRYTSGSLYITYLAGVGIWWMML